MVEETRHPYANVDSGIPSLIEAPRHPHPHDEPSMADEEGELILQSAGSSSDESNNIAPPSVNASEIASNLSVSSSSCLNGIVPNNKETVVVETTTEESALNTCPEEVISRPQIQIPDDDGQTDGGCRLREETPSFVESPDAEPLLDMVGQIIRPTVPIQEVLYDIEQRPDEIQDFEGMEDEEDEGGNRKPSICNAVTVGIAGVGVLFFLATATLLPNNTETGVAKEPPMMRASGLNATKGDSSERLMLTKTSSTEPKNVTVDVDANAQGETGMSVLIPYDTWGRFTPSPVAEELLKDTRLESKSEQPQDVFLLDDEDVEEMESEETEAGVEVDEMESVVQEESTLESTEEINEPAASTAIPEVVPTLGVQGYLRKSGEWLVKAILLLLSSCVVAKLSFMATTTKQSEQDDYSNVRHPPTSDDVIAFMKVCKNRLNRTGRCRRSNDDILHDKAEFYDIYTKNDLYLICQFLNVSNLSKISRNNKNYMMNELIHCYEDLLWGFTMTEIKSILQLHGVYYKSNTNKVGLVELAVEAAF